MREAEILSGLWTRFGIPAADAADADARYIRLINVLQIAEQTEGGEQYG